MKKRSFFLILLLTITNRIYAETQQADSYVNFTPVTVTSAKDEKPITINLPYNQSTYLLAFTTFLANGNIPAAVEIAKKATKDDPDNLLWHEKLAQVAVWNNDTGLAMEQLIIVLNVKNDKGTLDQVMKLGVYTGHFADVLSAGDAYFKKYPRDTTLVMSMVAAYNGLAEPQKAIALLHKVIRYDPKKVYFEQLISIYTTLQNNSAIQKTAFLQQKLEGFTGEIALTLADTYYATNDLKKAEQAMLQAAPKVSPKNVDFWTLLANNAWILNDFRVVMYAYQVLGKTNKLSFTDKVQYIQILIMKQPHEAMDQSIDLWRRNRRKDGLVLASNYLDSYYSLPLAIYFFSRISLNAEKALSNTPSYWSAKTRFLQDLQINLPAQQMLVTQIKNHSDDQFYLLLYINFLINQIYYGTVADSMSLLPATLMRWQYKANDHDKWASVYANAYLVLNDLLKAYGMDQFEFGTQKTNLDYLARFEGTVNDYGYHKMAKTLQLYTLSIIKKNQINKDDPNTYRVFLALGQPYISIDDYYRGLIWLSHQPGQQNKEPLLDWALANGQLALADAIAASYGILHTYPAWAQLKLAMQHNDVEEMYRLLLLHPATLPKDDYVTAANQINDISLAGLASIQTLQKPSTELNKNTPQMVQLITTASNSVKVSQEYDTYGFLVGNKTKVNATFNMGNNVIIEPYESSWFTKSSDETQLTNVPEVDQEVGVKYTKQTQKNWYQWDASLRVDLATFATLLFDDRYNFTPELSLDMQLGYNQLATQTTDLWITGVQDVANLALSYNFSSYDSVVASVNGSEFYSQERTYIGDGLQLMLQANHKFWLAYPDYTIGWFGEVDKFGDNGSVSPFMAQVIPADQTADLAAFIPQNFWQSGLSFNFGNNLLDTRTDRFRPYGNVSLFYNSVSGKGDSISIGLVGSLLGCDQLNLYASKAKNSGGLAQINQIIGIQYKYFYG